MLLAVAVAVAVASDRLGGEVPGVDEVPWRFLETQGFRGELGQCVAAPGPDGRPVLHVGGDPAHGSGRVAGREQGVGGPTRFVELAYEPARTTRSTPTFALVGKGITFDSGGLSIKTAEGMTTMKSDMGGGAAVLAAMAARNACQPQAWLPARRGC